MSVYTTQVRFICEDSIPLAEQGDYTDVNRAIEAGRKRIFTFDYDLFDENYKPVIETKFLRHYYVREIGMETVALWKLRLEDKWNMLLPYYNKLWRSELLEFNPFYDVDYQIINTGDRYSNVVSNGKMSSTSKDKSHNDNAGSGSVVRDEDLLNKFSDTPQGALNGVIDTDWLTNATQNDNTITTNSSERSHSNSLGEHSGESKSNNLSNVHDIDDYIKHVVGKMGTRNYSNMLLDFRKTFLNIDKMFIDEMNDLFMLVY